jgi:hypothetical protein
LHGQILSPSELSIPIEELKQVELPQSAANWRNKVWTLWPLYSPIYLYTSVDVADGPRRQEILSHGSLKDSNLEIIPGGNAIVGSPLMDTLDGFRRFWDASHTVHAFIVTDFSRVIYIVANGRIKAKLRWDPGLKPSVENRRLSLERRGIGSSQRGKQCYPEIEDLFLAEWSQQFNTFFCTWVPTNQDQPGPDVLVLLANSRNVSH